MPTETTGRTGGRALLLLAAVAVVAYGLDQLTKYLVVTNLVEGEQNKVLGDFLIFHFVRNSGAAFSLASGSTWIFSILASVVTVAIIVLARKIKSLAWGAVFGLLLGGVLGNLTDRFFREPSFGLGHVIDFISTPWMIPAIYNVADMSIVLSMVLFVLLTILGIGLDGSRDTGQKKTDDESAEEPVDPDAPVEAEESVEPDAQASSVAGDPVAGTVPDAARAEPDEASAADTDRREGSGT